MSQAGSFPGPPPLKQLKVQQVSSQRLLLEKRELDLSSPFLKSRTRAPRPGVWAPLATHQPGWPQGSPLRFPIKTPPLSAVSSWVIAGGGLMT